MTAVETMPPDARDASQPTSPPPVAPEPSAAGAGSRHRQWGAEKPRPPLPIIERPASNVATWMGGFAIAATMLAWIAYIGRTVISEFIDNGLHDSQFIRQTVAYVIVMSFLTFSALMYLLARQGALYRSRSHVRVPRAEIDAHFATRNPDLTVLVPSYSEDPAVVRSTLLSVALQEYPSMRVVLLLDDPPVPSSPEAAANLAGCRALAAEITELMRRPRDRFAAALARHEHATEEGSGSAAPEVRALAGEFGWGASWLRQQAAGYPRTDNSDEFVADEVFGALAGDFETISQALYAALDDGAVVPAERLTQFYRRLVWTFSAELTSFERKAFAHLPHDANKAMNLNAYMGLMGRSFATIDTRVGLILRESTAADATLVVPDSEYILTLDADSVLLREYCLRLVYHLEMPGNERIAVIQTPYSAFRGARTRLERIAGATTDIQHMLHQGMTYFSATFWVGANAVIRKIALDDIVEVSYVGGHEVRRYVQDRTVIEDTESSIDLVAHGWTLHNYGERLSYSATPPDFGSLVVQRARWANGGLLILPKFWKYVWASRKAGHKVPLAEIALRVNYMASICWASLGLVFLLVFPFNNQLLSPVILLAALPYFVAMSFDFHRMGYKRTDVFRVYGFNLILLAVNLAGTVKSMQQAAAKSKIAFARTPKVKDRTAAPALFILAAYLIAVFSFYTLANDVISQNWSNAVFAGFNGTLTTYSIIAFIGVRNSLVDIVVGAANWVRVPVDRPRREKRAESAADAAAPQSDWEAVLYFGPSQDGHVARAGKVAVADAPPPRRGDTRAHHRPTSPSAALDADCPVYPVEIVVAPDSGYVR